MNKDFSCIQDRNLKKSFQRRLPTDNKIIFDGPKVISFIIKCENISLVARWQLFTSFIGSSGNDSGGSGVNIEYKINKLDFELITSKREKIIFILKFSKLTT